MPQGIQRKSADYLEPIAPLASHQPNPPVSKAVIREMRPGDSIPPTRAPEGVSSLYDFSGKIADFLGDIGLDPSDFGNIDKGPQEAVTRFLMRSPVGNIPSTALREASAAKASKYAGYLGPQYKEAYDWFASRWPRVAAHMDIQPTLDKTDQFLAAARPHINGAQEQTTIPIHFSNLTEMMSPHELKSVIAHEGTHVAQTLGNKDFPRLYLNNDSIVGYPNNPFEMSANRREFSTLRHAGDKESQILNRQLTRKPADASEEDIVNQIHNRVSKRMAPAGAGNAVVGTNSASNFILSKALQKADELGQSPAQLFSPAYRQKLAAAADNLRIIKERAAKPIK